MGKVIKTNEYQHENGFGKGQDYQIYAKTVNGKITEFYIKLSGEAFRTNTMKLLAQDLHDFAEFVESEK